MKLILTLVVSLLASTAMARHYGDAGCGLGLSLMGKDGNQVLAATTNESSYTQLFGISSGTSGCTDDGAISENKAVPAYIEVNKIALAKDAARGEGETLVGLAQLMGCQAGKLGPAMKSNYNKIFVDSQMEPSDIEQSVRTLISSDKSNACGV